MTTARQSVSIKHPIVNIALEGFLPFPILADHQSPHAELKADVEILESSPSHVIARAILRNESKQPVAIKGLRWNHDFVHCRPASLVFPPALNPHYYCCENYRGDYFGTGTTEGDRFIYPLTTQTVEIGNSEESLFPGIFFRAAEAQAGFLIAQASQQRFHPIIRLKGQILGQERWFLEVEERVSGICSLTIEPGQSLAGEKIIFLMTDTNDPQLAARAYFAIVRPETISKRVGINPLPEQRIYCSWNYDFMADIDEAKMLGQIPILKEHFPMVKFLQLDDGYQTQHNPDQRAMIDLCYGDLASPFDPARFPDGPKAYCEKVRAAGLRPAIWLGLWASQGSQMLKDHPDWALRDDTGEVMWFSGWYGGTVILDPSHEGVRDYLHRMCRTVFQEWGFEGVKLDFSSFAYNMKRARFTGRSLTGVELRHELETIFRTYLPVDGFFGWCVVCGTAQPFLSQADYFRCAVDIGMGDWPTARRVGFWCANTNMLLQERPCLPNMDSIGWSKDFKENGWRTWLNLCAVNGGALEISGDLRKLDTDRLKILSKSMAMSDTSRKVRCLDVPCGPMANPPSIWLAENRSGTGGMLAIVNWSDDPVRIKLDYAELRALTGSLRDAWTHRVAFKAGLPAAIRLEGQSSRLLTF